VLVSTTSTLNVQATTAQLQATQSFEMSVGNPPQSSPLFVGGSYSTHGIQSVTLSANGTRVVLDITFRRPVDMAPGTYTDTLTIRACLDSSCMNHISGSPKSITVNYTVVQGANPVSMTLQQDSVAAEGFVLDYGAPDTLVVDASFQNVAAEVFTAYVDVSSTNAGIAQVRFNQSGSTRGRVSVDLKPPTSLGPGEYTDTVTVRACLDINCVNSLVGSPASFTVRYTVTDTVPGPNGYRVRPLAVVAHDVAWDPQRQLLYVSMASNAPAHANTIGVLDPQTGSFSSYAPVGNDPGRLEVSPDGQYLFVALRGSGAIQRLALPSLALDLTIPTGTQPGTAVPIYAKEMHASPASPHTLGVVRAATSTTYGNELDLVIFDDDVMRPAVASGVKTFQWDSPTRIFSVAGSTASQLAVDAAGLHVTSSQTNVASAQFDAYLLNGRMHMQRGLVFDPLTFAPIGSFPIPPTSGTAMALDAEGNRAFLVVNAALTSHDLTTFAPVASAWLPRSSPNSYVARMVRWGRDGLAVLNYQDPVFGAPGLLLVDGPFVRP
jgi:hypothetical protein